MDVTWVNPGVSLRWSPKSNVCNTKKRSVCFIHNSVAQKERKEEVLRGQAKDVLTKLLANDL